MHYKNGLYDWTKRSSKDIGKEKEKLFGYMTIYLGNNKLNAIRNKKAYLINSHLVSFSMESLELGMAPPFKDLSSFHFLLYSF